MQESTAATSSCTFLYFAYGSNLLTERIRLNNPTAVKMDVAKLQGYKLNFAPYGDRWRGAVATITPCSQPEGHVWGVVWRVPNYVNLDRQEEGYDPIEVSVESQDGRRYRCRTYELIRPRNVNYSKIDGRRKPSVVYKDVIVKGAIENGLPDTYVESLCGIEDNGYDGPVKVQLSYRG